MTTDVNALPAQWDAAANALEAEGDYQAAKVPRHYAAVLRAALADQAQATSPMEPQAQGAVAWQTRSYRGAGDWGGWIECSQTAYDRVVAKERSGQARALGVLHSTETTEDATGTSKA